MAKINGTLFRLKVGSVIVGSTISVDFSLDQDNPLTTNQDSEQWKESLANGGIRSASGSCKGLVDPDNNYNAEELLDVIINNSGLLSCQVGVVGGTYYSFSAKLKNVKQSGTMQEALGLDFSWESSGAVTKNSTMTS